MKGRALLSAAGWTLSVTFLGILLLAVAFGYSMIRRGISARDEPGAVEAFLAGRMRHWAIPAKVRALANPLASSADAIAAGRAHFADHCAVCHGNDGRGQTEIGRNLYPKAPNMQAARTQSLSDGEIFAIIKNGVRLTGMPAWGENTPEDDRASWELVSFVRHLPRITPEEIEQMKELNPVSLLERKEAEEEREFLEGAAEKGSPERGAPSPKEERRKR